MVSLKNSDMPRKGWWDFFPKKTHKWIRLGRFDRLIGTWLLLLPCLWTLPIFLDNLNDLLKLYLIFFLGALSMRSAGCIINDLWDKDIDKKISRTKSRPIASGEVSTKEALVFLLFLLLIGLICLLQLNKMAWAIALLSMPLIILYPLAKRITKWPQIILGFTFSWGVLTAWASTDSKYHISVLFIYLGTVFWITGYDTIYGFQDKKDDKKHGIKNSAITTEKYLIKFILFLYTFSAISFLLAGIFIDIHYGWYIGLTLMYFHFLYQLTQLREINRESALKIFKSNKFSGMFLTFGSFSKFLF